MKTYTSDDLLRALRSAPEAVRAFAVSPTLMSIYDGIQKKHRLPDNQMILFSRVANITLLGLEPESAIETNIHQVLPELSHATTVELVADLSTRILKEANRRQSENIKEPSAYSDLLASPVIRDEEYERLNNLDEDDPTLKDAQEKERAQERLERKAFEATYAEEQAKTRPPVLEEEDDDNFFDDEAEVKLRYDIELEALDKEYEEKLALVETQESGVQPQQNSVQKISTPGAQASAVNPPNLQSVTSFSQYSEIEEPSVTIPKVSIATQKLSAPTAQQGSTSQVESVLGRGISSVEVAGATDAPTQKEARPTRSLEKTDPYRESVD